MTTLDRGEDKLKFEELMVHYDQDDISGSCSVKSEKPDSPVAPSVARNSSTSAAANMPSSNAAVNTAPASVDEKRMRREIANSNERRRMQSINAGFQSLRALLPHHVGEKLSKAAILQQAAEYLYQLEQERTQLLSQNCHLKRIISQHEGELALSSSPPSPSAPSKKRKLVDTSDDDVTNCDEFLELKAQLEREHALRIHFEEKVQRLESLYTITPDKLQDSLSSEQITLQYHKDEIKDESILHTFENGHELECSRGGDDDDNDDDSTAHGVGAELKRPITATTSVILQPVVAHEESLIAPTLIGGHQYSAPTVLVNQSVCSPIAVATTTTTNPSSTSIKLKPKIDLIERIGLSSPTSVSLVTTITSTHLTTTTTNSSPLICNNVSSPSSQQIVPSARVYLTSTSRQNLETIVEAIRHLEGDTLFESASVATASTHTSSSSSSSACTSPNSSNQDVPLALTKRNSQTVLQVDMNPFLRFHTREPGQGDVTPSVNVSAEQQQRPGVIVVKQQT